VDAIIKRQLNYLGAQIRFEAKQLTRVDENNLKPSINFFVKPYTQLNFTQNIYGKWITPNNVPMPKRESKQGAYPSPPYNALRITIDDMKPEGVEHIKKELTDYLLSPFRKK